jgi:hypothetical protein
MQRRGRETCQHTNNQLVIASVLLQSAAGVETILGDCRCLGVARRRTAGERFLASLAADAGPASRATGMDSASKSRLSPYNVAHLCISKCLMKQKSRVRALERFELDDRAARHRRSRGLTMTLRAGQRGDRECDVRRAGEMQSLAVDVFVCIRGSCSSLPSATVSGCFLPQRNKFLPTTVLGSSLLRSAAPKEERASEGKRGIDRAKQGARG